MNRLKNSYRTLLVIVGIIGVLVETNLEPAKFLYYTIMSNILCILYFAYLLVKKQGYNPNVKGAVTLAITVTMLIYWCILAPHSFNMKTFADYAGTFLAHLIVPMMVILDWLFFDQKGGFSKKAPIYWLIIPLVYYVFTLIAAQFKVVYPLTGAHYPYFFIDSEAIGWAAVAGYVSGLVLFFLILGYLFVLLDHKLAKRK
ncbi:Pr6Pr family membrane protein [Fructobacillus sp. M1-13]|uniref:Integral membrane protein n=1 Tax=Fructobacillus papyriferae TaxID=2713171 RepID=A0ABS5QQ42_9LACO|nr:Pr6Pr family membrane protein [Fructobacillus papyriferae]MBS9335271.1 hypothetical protein [Fructobacillus papyriferae]MCD2159060.1 Pr6Pr family membrane protein [Fructobacillus papyriferae]